MVSFDEVWFAKQEDPCMYKSWSKKWASNHHVNQGAAALVGCWFRCGRKSMMVKVYQIRLLKNLCILECGWSTSSFVSIPIRTSIPFVCHCWISVIKSFINCFFGSGLVTPCWRRSHVCCAVTVIVVASNCWEQIRYADTTTRHIPWHPTNSR